MRHTQEVSGATPPPASHLTSGHTPQPLEDLHSVAPIATASDMKDKRIGEGVEPCNMPLKTSLPMRPSIRFKRVLYLYRDKGTLFVFIQSEQNNLFII